ncbi:hypothetical protein GCM10009609_37900 [Pseudonocardia aurantiaca]
MHDAGNTAARPYGVTLVATGHASPPIIDRVLVKDLRRCAQNAQHVLGEHSITERPVLHRRGQGTCHRDELAVFAFRF